MDRSQRFNTTSGDEILLDESVGGRTYCYAIPEALAVESSHFIRQEIFVAFWRPNQDNDQLNLRGDLRGNFFLFGKLITQRLVDSSRGAHLWFTYWELMHVHLSGTMIFRTIRYVNGDEVSIFLTFFNNFVDNKPSSCTASFKAASLAFSYVFYWRRLLLEFESLPPKVASIELHRFDFCKSFAQKCA